MVEPECLRNEPFYVGMDANFVPDLRDGNPVPISTEDIAAKKYRWHYRGSPIENFFRFFAERGVSRFRLRLWTGEDGHSGLNYACRLAHEVRDNGLEPYLFLNLSASWGRNVIPSAWQGLGVETLCERVASYAESVARRLKDEGIAPSFYVIGNETEFGLCGQEDKVARRFGADLREIAGKEIHMPRLFAYGYPGSIPADAAGVLERLRSGLWQFQASVMAAAQRGIRAVCPDAKFGAHIEFYWEPNLASCYFSTLAEYGVSLDYPCLSYYPGLEGDASADAMKETVTLLWHDLKRPVLLTEAAYASEENRGMFTFLNTPTTGHPLTPAGQASWARSLLEWARRNPRIRGVVFWAPELYPGITWQPQSFFDAQGEAKPIVDVLQEFASDHGGVTA